MYAFPEGLDRAHSSHYLSSGSLSSMAMRCCCLFSTMTKVAVRVVTLSGGQATAFRICGFARFGLRVLSWGFHF